MYEYYKLYYTEMDATDFTLKKAGRNLLMTMKTKLISLPHRSIYNGIKFLHTDITGRISSANIQ